jgi:hypothetical protein
VALPLTLKSIFKAKEELWKLKYFTLQKNIIFNKYSKRNQNPSRYYNFITKFQVSTQAKISSFKIPYIKIDLYIRAKIL